MTPLLAAIAALTAAATVAAVVVLALTPRRRPRWATPAHDPRHLDPGPPIDGGTLRRANMLWFPNQPVNARYKLGKDPDGNWWQIDQEDDSWPPRYEPVVWNPETHRWEHA